MTRVQIPAGPYYIRFTFLRKTVYHYFYKQLIRICILRIFGFHLYSARSLTTPEEAKELLIPVLRGCGNYFAHSLASKSFAGIWNYAQCRLMYMYCHQHNIPRKWKNRNIPKYNLSIMNTKPSTFLGNARTLFYRIF